MRQVWFRLFLLATTGRPGRSDPWRFFRKVEDDLRGRGWSVRVASPRYHAVWADATEVCCTLRVVVLPGRARDLSLAEADAYLRARLCRLGLADDLPPDDVPELASAERKLWAALAPHWLGRGGTLEMVPAERPRPPWA